MTARDLQAVLRRFEREAIAAELPAPNYTMRYHAWGDGPPLVFVHGLNDVPLSFAPLMAQLSDSYRCIAVALPEGGPDRAVLSRYQHTDFPRDLLALLDELDLESAALLGSSFGSTVALRFAAEHPERVRRLVLQGGFARRPLSTVERGLVRALGVLPLRMGDLPLRPQIVKKLEGPAFINAPEMLDFLLANSACTPIRATAHRAKILTTLDLRPLLPAVAQPLLMIGGDRDTIVPRTFEAEVEAGVAGARRVEFERCGHYPQYTHPEEMAAAIRQFLN